MNMKLWKREQAAKALKVMVQNCTSNDLHVIAYEGDPEAVIMTPAAYQELQDCYLERLAGKQCTHDHRAEGRKRA